MDSIACAVFLLLDATADDASWLSFQIYSLQEHRRSTWNTTVRSRCGGCRSFIWRRGLKDGSVGGGDPFKYVSTLNLKNDKEGNYMYFGGKLNNSIQIYYFYVLTKRQREKESHFFKGLLWLS